MDNNNHIDDCNNFENHQIRKGANLSSDTISFANDYSKRNCIETDSGCFSLNQDPNAACALKKTSNLLQYMGNKSDRLESFKQHRWLKYIVDPQALSTAGFYYFGIDDKVKCFSCTGIIGDWNFTDDPWEEHAFWFPACKFVQQEKGPLFVASIKKKWSQHLKILSDGNLLFDD